MFVFFPLDIEEQHPCNLRGFSPQDLFFHSMAKARPVDWFMFWIWKSWSSLKMLKCSFKLYCISEDIYFIVTLRLGTYFELHTILYLGLILDEIYASSSTYFFHTPKAHKVVFLEEHLLTLFPSEILLPISKLSILPSQYMISKFLMGKKDLLGSVPIKIEEGVKEVS